MIPENKKLYLVLIALLVAFAIGRYSAGGSSTKSTEDKKTTDTKQVDTNTHSQTTTTVTEDPNGTKKTTTVVTTDTTTKSKDTEVITDRTTQSTTPTKRNTINISALVGVDISKGFIPSYGISASKEFIGPITIGAFGLTSGTVGLSLGLNF